VNGFLASGDSGQTDFLGILASTFNTLMYGSPLSIMFQVIQTKSVEFMPLPLTIMTSFSCITWGLYAFYVGDIFIGIPNYIGILLCILQYILYGTYYYSTYDKNGHLLLIEHNQTASKHSSNHRNISTSSSTRISNSGSVNNVLHVRLTNSDDEVDDDNLKSNDEDDEEVQIH